MLIIYKTSQAFIYTMEQELNEQYTSRIYMKERATVYSHILIMS